MEIGGSKVYRQSGHFQKVALIALALIALIGIAGTLTGDPGDSGGPFLILWFGVLAFMGIKFLDLPFEITMSRDGAADFRSYLRHRQVDAKDIVSVAPYAGGFSPGWVTLRHRRGSIVLITQFDDFHDLVCRLKELNPQIRTRGV